MKRFSLQLLTGRNAYPEHVRRQLLTLLYENLSNSSLVVLFNASLFTYVLWPLVNHLWLGIWYVSLSLLTLARFLDTVQFFKTDEHEFRYWYRRMFVGVTLSAMLWSIVPLLFFPESNTTYHLFIIVIIVGMSAGAVSTLAADPLLAAIYLFALLIPLGYRMLQQNETIYNATFILLLALVFILSHAGRQFHLSLVKSFSNLELYRLAQERVRMMFEQAPVGICYYDTDLIIVDANHALCNALQVEREQLIGLNLTQLPDQRMMQSAYRNCDFSKRGLYEGPYHTKIRGLDLWVKAEFIPIIDEDDVMIGGMIMFTDLTKEHDAMEQAAFLSLHDPLTMLPNRKLLKERISQLLKEEQRSSRHSALLFLDLDRFKQINDTAGHIAGDQLLVDVAKRLEHLLRASDTLSRLGGDEFVVLLPMLAEKEDSTIHHAFQVAEKIHEALRSPFMIDGYQLYITCSIGITIIDSQAEFNVDEILRRADTAMYQSKDEGRDRTRFYDPSMDQKARVYLGIQQYLRQAIDAGAFALFYQPIVHINTNTVVAAEALLRWQDENGRDVSPAVFIPVAEETGLINAIGQWVINEACRQISLWQYDPAYTIDYISINISPRQMIEPDFPSFLTETIHRYGINPAALRLEITETALIENFEETKVLIETLNNKGIKFIIDDFGTGYSSLAYLKQLPFCALKIDKSFIKDILDDPKDAALIRSIINIAEQFDYQIIAEGVETEAQRSVLMQTDKTIYYQGYLCSCATNAGDFTRFLRTKIS